MMIRNCCRNDCEHINDESSPNNQDLQEESTKKCCVVNNLSNEINNFFTRM